LTHLADDTARTGPFAGHSWSKSARHLKDTSSVEDMFTVRWNDLEAESDMVKDYGCQTIKFLNRVNRNVYFFLNRALIAF